MSRQAQGEAVLGDGRGEEDRESTGTRWPPAPPAFPAVEELYLTAPWMNCWPT